jgi:flagellar hook-basal body complex protein FliE
MTDPLGFIGRGAGELGGAGGLGGIGPSGGQGAEQTNASGPSFKDVLMENIKQVNDLQQDATKAVEDLTTGKRNDVEGVMLATQKADMAFKMLVQLRNKMQGAYEEIKQLRV